MEQEQQIELETGPEPLRLNGERHCPKCRSHFAHIVNGDLILTMKDGSVFLIEKISRLAITCQCGGRIEWHPALQATPPRLPVMPAAKVA